MEVNEQKKTAKNNKQKIHLSVLSTFQVGFENKQTQHKHPKNPDQTSQPKGLFGLAMLATTRWFVASSQLLQLFWARLDRGGVIYFAREKFQQTWNQAYFIWDGPYFQRQTVNFSESWQKEKHSDVI